jgi:hypothetical protein
MSHTQVLTASTGASALKPPASIIFEERKNQMKGGRSQTKRRKNNVRNKKFTPKKEKIRQIEEAEK